VKSVVVTGVSTGIGHGATRVLIDQGLHVFGSVRKQADADRLAAEFGENFTPLLFDVTDEAAIGRAALQVREALDGGTLFGLVNNAGVAAPGPMIEMDPREFRQQLAINLEGPFLVVQAFAPLLGVDDSLEGEPGRIINISSVAGVRALPFLGAYAASKFGLEGYSEALRRELLLFGIDVIVIGPGPVKTSIWDKAEEIDTSRYENSPYAPLLERFQKAFVIKGRNGYSQERLGKLIHKALTTPRPRVRYAAVKSGIVEKLMLALAPPRVIDRVIGKAVGLLPGK
jgi:NAD(P)-dependent dehydrogenase (short-subunit alcohol dehydrogenase family)